MWVRIRKLPGADLTRYILCALHATFFLSLRTKQSMTMHNLEVSTGSNYRKVLASLRGECRHRRLTTLPLVFRGCFISSCSTKNHSNIKLIVNSISFPLLFFLILLLLVNGWMETSSWGINLEPVALTQNDSALRFGQGYGPKNHPSRISVIASTLHF